MSHDTITIDHAVHEATLFLKHGNPTSAKNILFQVLKQTPHDVHSRSLLRSTIETEPSEGLPSFGDRFESTYMSDPTFFLRHAARGWLYSIAIDNKFIEPDLPSGTQRPRTSRPLQQSLELGNRTPAQLLADLLAIQDIEEQWDAVHAVVSGDERAAVEDSFGGSSRQELPQRLLTGQLQRGLNVVILGAGCVGLALANALKWSFREKIDVIVIENRIQRPHIKRPYCRHWLTHLPNAVLNGVYDPQVTQLLSDFGTNGYAGATLAMFETLLLISNKKLGVRFLFDEEYDLSFISASNTHLIFDATAGRFAPPPEALSAGTASHAPKTFQTWLPTIKEFGRGHHRHGITNWVDVQEQAITVNRTESMFHPMWNEKVIKTAMCKLTNVPVSLYQTLFEFASTRNDDGLFYIWPGNLQSQLNRILVLINLDLPSYECFTAHLPENMSLSAFIESGALNAPINRRIIELMNLLSETGVDLTQIGIEPPFIYAPYVRLMTGKLDRLWERPLVPVGDSIMNGHPKVGNGLLIHLCSILKLHDTAILHYGT